MRYTGRRVPRGNYYATGTETRDDGKRYGVEVARQAKTLTEARARLDARNLPGYVQYWVEREQRRVIVAERDADGTWWSRNPYTGERVPLAALTGATS